MSMMTLGRRAAQRVGLDVTRLRSSHPLAPVAAALEAKGVSMVVDVGANRGNYALDLRRLGYQGRIVSFEPVKEVFELSCRRARGDDRWQVQPYALGAENRQVEINVAANLAASSSVLEMLPVCEIAAPNARIVRQETVAQRRLDSVWSEMVGVGQKAFVKLDVQGYERHVLEGASACLESELIVGLQMELSYVELYSGSWLANAAMEWAEARDFRIT